ncbi:MAG: hypothetical protein ACKO3N_19050, partial [Verrucomicrobiota bacterium]
MSDPLDLNLDLEKAFLPSWAQSPAENRYANYEVREDRGDRRDGRRSGPPRFGGGPGAGGGGGPRPFGDRRPGPGGPRFGGGGPGRGPGGGPRPDRRDGPRPAGP